ncbi:MAG: hypothetical protein WCX73_00945 [Candidatus Pacearchaeota archaeon]|jgi:large-conductance mechanosensitive channel
MGVQEALNASSGILNISKGALNTSNNLLTSGSDLLNTSTELITSLPNEISNLVSRGIMIAQILGIVILVYILFLIIRGIYTWKRNQRINIIYEKVLEMDKKLDELLKRSSKKEKVAEKPEKTSGLFSWLFRKKENEKTNKK